MHSRQRADTQTVISRVAAHPARAGGCSPVRRDTVRRNGATQMDSHGRGRARARTDGVTTDGACVKHGGEEGVAADGVDLEGVS